MVDSITPSQDLRDKWLNEAPNTSVYDYFIDRAAQWGAEQELEACCKWLSDPANTGIDIHITTAVWCRLRAARLPKPPNLKEEALEQLDSFQSLLDMAGLRSEIIRRALEALPDD
jgi:hypothetical protein